MTRAPDTLERPRAPPRGHEARLLHPRHGLRAGQRRPVRAPTRSPARTASSRWPLMGWAVGLAVHGLVAFVGLGAGGLRERMLPAERAALPPPADGGASGRRLSCGHASKERHHAHPDQDPAARPAGAGGPAGRRHRLRRARRSRAPMRSITDPFRHADYRGAAAARSSAARDGTPLAFRAYAAGRHAARQRGAGARLLGRAAAACTCWPRRWPRPGWPPMRWTCAAMAASGSTGQIAYVGQLDDDLEDFVRTRAAGAAGHAGRLLGRRRLCAAHRRRRAAGAVRPYLLLAPFISQDAPTYRPDSGGWVSVGVPRIVGAEPAERRAACMRFDGAAGDALRAERAGAGDVDAGLLACAGAELPAAGRLAGDASAPHGSRCGCWPARRTRPSTPSALPKPLPGRRQGRAGDAAAGHRPCRADAAAPGACRRWWRRATAPSRPRADHRFTRDPT